MELCNRLHLHSKGAVNMRGGAGEKGSRHRHMCFKHCVEGRCIGTWCLAIEIAPGDSMEAITLQGHGDGQDRRSVISHDHV